MLELQTTDLEPEIEHNNKWARVQEDKTDGGESINTDKVHHLDRGRRYMHSHLGRQYSGFYHPRHVRSFIPDTWVWAADAASVK